MTDKNRTTDHRNSKHVKPTQITAEEYLWD